MHNVLTSKRIAVAFCAAIAMVLGAMSVGATMHIYGSGPEPAQQGGTPISNVVSPTTFQGVDLNNANKPAPVQTKKTPQEILTPILVSPPKSSDGKKQKPTLVKPDINSQTALTIGPVNVSADVSDDGLQVDTSLTPSVTVQIPDILQPSETPDSNSANPPTEDGNNDSQSLLTTLSAPVQNLVDPAVQN